jgi:hypothetical protein
MSRIADDALWRDRYSERTLFQVRNEAEGGIGPTVATSSASGYRAVAAGKGRNAMRSAWYDPSQSVSPSRSPVDTPLNARLGVS